MDTSKTIGIIVNNPKYAHIDVSGAYDHADVMRI